MRRAVWVLLALSVVQACAAPTREARIDADPCTIAGDLVAAMLPAKGDKPIVFTEENEGFPRSVTAQGAWYEPTTDGPVSRASPPATLTNTFNRSMPQNAVKVCANVRAMLSKAAVAYGEGAVDRAVEPKRITPRGYSEKILHVSLPVVAGDDALVYTSAVSAPEGGGGSASHLRRDANGRWVVVAIQGLWVS